MFAVVITEKSGGQRRMEFDKNEVTIGRVQGNDIILPKGNVSKRHSRIVLKDNRFIVVDLKSTNGTYVNGRKITSPLVVKPGDKVYIGDFIMNVEELAAAAAAGPPPLGPSAGPPSQGASGNFAQPPGGFGGGPPPLAPSPVSEPVAAPPMQPAPLPAAPPPSAPAAPAPAAPIAVAPAPAAPMAPPPAAAPIAAAPVAPAPVAAAPVAAAPVAPAPIAAAPAPSRPVSAPPPPLPSAPAPTPPPSSSLRENTIPPAAPSLPPSAETKGLADLMAEVASSFDTSEISSRSQLDLSRRAAAKAAIAKAFSSAGIARTDELAQAALQEAVGLGVLEAFLADASVTEILVDGPSRVQVDRGQGLSESGATFSTAAALATVGRRLLARGGHDATTHVGVVDLPGGETASVVLPPIAASGTIIEIRRGGQVTAETLVGRGVLNTDIANALTGAVNSGHGVAVLGPANATRDVLALLASGVPASERLVCVDAAQVPVGRPHVALTSGAGVSGSELVRQAGRLRADRLLVASVSVGEVFGVIGAAGGMGSAIVGVSAGGGIPTLELGVKLGGVPESATFGFLASAVRLVVVVERVGQDARVTEVSELGGAGVSTLFRWNGNDFAAENASTLN